MLSGKFLTTPMTIQLSIPKKEKIQIECYLFQNAIITAFHTRVAGATVQSALKHGSHNPRFQRTGIFK